MGTTGVYCTIRIIFYYILIICCFFLLQVSFILSLLLLYGWVGICFGTIFVKQWEDDEYMYQCDNLFFFFPTPFTNPMP